MKKKRKLTITDLILSIILLLLCLFFVYRIKVGLNYNWAWDSIFQFIFRFDDESNKWVSGLLMTGFYTTIRLSLWGIILATVFGVVTGIAKTSNILFFRWLATTYVETMHNLPPLVRIFCNIDSLRIFYTRAFQNNVWFFSSPCQYQFPGSSLTLFPPGLYLACAGQDHRMAGV